jgi:hypothetical protein
VGTSANIGLPLPQRIYHNVTGQEAVATASQPEPSHTYTDERDSGATAVLGCFTGVTDERLAILLLFQEVPGSNIDWRQTVMKPELFWDVSRASQTSVYQSCFLFQEVPGSNIDWRHAVMKSQLFWDVSPASQIALSNPASYSGRSSLEYRPETGCND